MGVPTAIPTVFRLPVLVSATGTDERQAGQQTVDENHWRIGFGGQP
jgi:hypothetical protein